MIYGIYGIEGALLFLAGIEDIRKKEIHILSIIVMGVLSLCGCFLRQDGNWYGAMGGFFIGLCMIGVSKISQEQIGCGDGMVVAAIGILCGVRNTLGIICLSSLFMVIPALFIVISKKGNKKTKLPFIPALFLGFITNICLGGIV